MMAAAQSDPLAVTADRRVLYRGVSELQLFGVAWPNQLPHLSQPDRPSASTATTAILTIARMGFPVRPVCR
jgi:hypothetical protein